MEINSLAGYFPVITDVVFFLGGRGRKGGRREGERWKHSVQFVCNFFELTVRHITFKRLKVGHRVRCSVLYTVLHHDRNNEFERKMIHQQLMMDGESDLVLWKQVRKRWRRIKCQNLSCPLFQKMMFRTQQ